MKKGILFLVVMLALWSCDKDTFQTRPSLTLKSVSSEIIPRNSDMQIIMRMTDAEGDVGDTLWVKKTTTRCVFSNFADSIKYRIPEDLPRVKNLDGDLTVTFSYALELAPQCRRPDTAVFSFWIKDKKGNVSDTAKTPQIIILN
jgi:hypothetical protein